MNQQKRQQLIAKCLHYFTLREDSDTEAAFIVLERDNRVVLHKFGAANLRAHYAEWRKATGCDDVPQNYWQRPAEVLVAVLAIRDRSAPAGANSCINLAFAAIPRAVLRAAREANQEVQARRMKQMRCAITDVIARARDYPLDQQESREWAALQKEYELLLQLAPNLLAAELVKRHDALSCTLSQLLGGLKETGRMCAMPEPTLQARLAKQLRYEISNVIARARRDYPLNQGESRKWAALQKEFESLLQCVPNLPEAELVRRNNSLHLTLSAMLGRLRMRRLRTAQVN